MLRYLGYGYRHFGQKPLSPHTRINWEFYAVLEGRCALWPAGGPKPGADSLEENTLWIFPPEHAHGWTGERKHCRVLVLHYGSVAATLAQKARLHGFLKHKMSAAEARRVEAIAQELQPHYSDPIETSPLHAQKAQVELALMVMEGNASRLPTHAGLARRKMEHVVSYFEEHLREGPTVAQAARAAAISPGHLRRLFKDAGRESPRMALRRVAMEHAISLLAGTDITLDAVAEQCGFSGASEFSRAFKRHFKVPPAVWRAGVLPPYQRPVRIHGRLQFPQASDQVVGKLRRYGMHT
jgi:AraC family transcriptional regulator